MVLTDSSCDIIQMLLQITNPYKYTNKISFGYLYIRANS